MAGSSSPAGRRWPSQKSPSPVQQRRSDFLSDDRNNAMSHREALDAALAEHMRINATALQALSIYNDEQEGKRLKQLEDDILAKQRREEERLQKERKVREEQERLRALEEQSVPKLPPKPAPQPAPQQQQQQQQQQQPPPAEADSQPNGTAAATGQNGSTATAKSSPFGLPSPAPASGVPKIAPTQVNGQAAAASPFGAKPAASSTGGLFGAAKPAATPAANPFGAPTPASTAPAQPAKTSAAPEQDRYVQIHKNLKRLRASLAEQAKTNPDLKSRMGDMRREIRKCLGQLTSVKGQNRDKLEKIKRVLTDALNGSPSSAPVDPSDYVVGRREPVEGALHNEAQLPSLFLYLINQLGKGIINQFINECGAAPRAADPLGVVTAQLFCQKEFLWRGKSLIDILMAKFRVVCPVLFGYRGSDRTEQGRARLGWWKDGGAWISEQQHTDRMMGLGVGYASIALRDFSRSPNANPWPPSHFWRAVAAIVNTPPDEISDTQCVVLKSMLALHEDKFIGFYGSAALAAMRKALVDFPNSAPKKTSGVMGLTVLAQVYKRDVGLDLGV